MGTGLLDDRLKADIEAEADAEAARAREGAIAAGPHPPEELFEHVLRDAPPSLLEQRSQMLAEIEAGAD